MIHRQTITLSIKRDFFNQILSGHKIAEYRADTPFFRKRLHDKLTHIVLHYYTGDRLTCSITAIEKVPNPFLNEQYAFLQTPLVYKINLSNPTLTNKLE